MKTAIQMTVKGNFKIHPSRIHKNANQLFKLFHFKNTLGLY